MSGVATGVSREKSGSSASLQQFDCVRTIKETATILGIGEPSLRVMIREGRGPQVTRLSARRIGIRDSHRESWLANSPRGTARVGCWKGPADQHAGNRFATATGSGAGRRLPSDGTDAGCTSFRWSVDCLPRLSKHVVRRAESGISVFRKGKQWRFPCTRRSSGRPTCDRQAVRFQSCSPGPVIRSAWASLRA
jgi:hypothetical protein